MRLYYYVQSYETDFSAGFLNFTFKELEDKNRNSKSWAPDKESALFDPNLQHYDIASEILESIAYYPLGSAISHNDFQLCSANAKSG